MVRARVRVQRMLEARPCAHVRTMMVALLAILGAAASPVSAQNTGTIQGVVTDSASQRPLSGVQVVVQGLGRVARTSEGGTFQIADVPAGTHTVRATRIGHRPAEAQAIVTTGGTANVRLELPTTTTILQGVVVTALGIEREERSISTSVSTLSGTQLTEARDPNIVASLSGKVAGVQVTNANSAGGSSRVVIRGANSLTGNNQPLFVVDGVPVSNASDREGTRGYNAVDYGNAIQDINPNDVESVTLLKGPNAAAIYGSRAANGAILITTKSGRNARGSQITASTNMTFETPLKLPTYQNSYGQGWAGQFSYVDGRGGGTNDDYDESWGPRLDGRLLPQFDSPIDASGNRIATPWIARPNNVRDFFETGRTLYTNASFATSSDRANVRLSFGQTNQDGMLPGFKLDRTNVSLHGGSTLTDRLRTDASVQYIAHSAANRPAQGYGGANTMWQFLWFGRQVDTRVLRTRTRNPDGSQFNWNNIWNNNPYFTAFENRNQDARDRVIGNASVAWDVLPWLTATVRSGTDWSEENRRRQYAAGNYSVSGVDRTNGALFAGNVFRQETNSDFLLQSRLLQDSPDLTLDVDFGGNRRDNRYRGNGISIAKLAIPGVYSYANYADPPVSGDYRERRAVNSLYGQARAGYRDMFFLDLTGRNDWSSTLPEDNNSYFYPAVSGSVIVSEMMTVPSMTFARIRAGWASVGNDAEPYQLIDPYGFDVPFGTAPRLTASNTLRNANLKPERTRSWEIGSDLRFLDDRLSIEGTFYEKATTNQIVSLDVSPMTGFESRVVNAGKISNRGFEIMVDAIPVRLRSGLEWNLNVNFTRDRATVDELYQDLQTLTLGNYYGVTVEARKGERYGAMYGRKYVRDSEGNIVIGSNGQPLNNSSNPVGYLGNYNPDWLAGVTNSLSFKGVTVSGLLDIRKGGTIYSLTNFYGRRSGVLIETLQGRENTPFDSLVVPGVRVVNGDTVPNTVKTSAQSYHRGLGNGLTEAFTFDASYIKLRELTFGYTLPQRANDLLRVTSSRFAIVGRNLWLSSDVPHIDPETAFDASNVQGFEYSQMPSARSFGFTFTITP